VGYENYFISMASDLIYEHYPIDTVIPANNYQSKLITVYVPPAMKTSDAEDGAYGPPCRWGGPCPFESEHDRVHNKICDCSGNIVEFVHLVKLPRSNDIEGELFIKSVLSSEPLAGRDVMNRSNFSSDSYTKAYFVPEPSPDCSISSENSSISSDNSSPINTQANQEETGEPEVTLISADDIASEGDLAFSPQFFIPESTPDSISSYNYSPINMQANEEVGEILGSNLLNRGEAMEVDADLYREVMMNVEGQAVMETINPILLLPDLPISNPDPVECEDSPPSKEDSPLSDMSDREFFELEQEILNLGKSIGRGNKGQSSTK
jgi:hypothetical protein